MMEVIATNQTILVVGGGISGITAALEVAETGKHVILVEKRPFIGGRTTQLYKYFPKLCFPTCGLEINQRRIQANPRLKVLTMADVTNVDGSEGDYTVSVKISPRYVNENCTACGACADAVDTQFENDFNYNMDRHKGAYLPYNMAYPQRYVLDPRLIGTEEADRVKAACEYDAIDLDMQEEVIEIKAGAIVWATGWQPYDADKIQPYGYDRIDNVVISVEFERMMDPLGPSSGKLIRPSDNKEAKNVAFIQCAGSRDRNHLRHCSRICCMASLKQSTYVREQFGDSGEVTIYYIYIRAIDRFEDLYKNVQTDSKVNFVKSKVAKIEEDKTTGNPICHGVDTEGYHMRTPGTGGEDFYRSGQDKGIIFTKGEVSEVVPANGSLSVKFKDLILNEEVTVPTDMVVLATGLVPNSGPDPDAELKAEEGGEAAATGGNESEPSVSTVTVEPILNLDYRQGTDLPQLIHGFTDSNFICFPYETRRTGIYTAGPVRRPMDMLQAREDATGAAMKAI